MNTLETQAAPTCARCPSGAESPSPPRAPHSPSPPLAAAMTTRAATPATAVTTAGEPSTAAVSDPPATTAPPDAIRRPHLGRRPIRRAPPTTVDEAPSGSSDDELAAQIEAVLADAIAPGSIRWDASGVDVPPTAAVAAVRIPGRDDVLVAVGENVDGTPAEADAPFPVASLTESLVRTVAFQLVDEGVLDPTLTVDQWVPTLPNADRVTVQMVHRQRDRLERLRGRSSPTRSSPTSGERGRCARRWSCVPRR